MNTNAHFEYVRHKYLTKLIPWFALYIIFGNLKRGLSQLHLAKAKCLINIAMFSDCIIIVNVIDWNWNIDSRYDGKIDIASLHSYFPIYTSIRINNIERRNR